MPSSSKLLKKAPVSGTRLYRVDVSPITAAGESPLPKESPDGSASPGKDGAGGEAAVPFPDGPEAARAGMPEEYRREMEQLRESMIREVEQERQLAVQKGYEEGYTAGFEEGKKEAEARCRQLIQEAAEQLEQARRSARKIVAASEKTIVELAVGVAEKLLRSQLEMAPEKVVAIVKEAINSLPEGDTIKVYLNPEDLPACLRCREVRPEAIPAGGADPQGDAPGQLSGGVGKQPWSSFDEEKRLQEALLEIARKEISKTSRRALLMETLAPWMGTASPWHYRGGRLSGRVRQVVGLVMEVSGSAPSSARSARSRQLPGR